MHQVRHTITAEAAGFPQVDVEFNVAVKGAAVDAAGNENAAHVFVTDLPNWDAVAADLDCLDADGAPLPKPAFPLTREVVNDLLPLPLGTWLTSGLGISVAVGDYMFGVVVPNSTRR